MDEIFLQDYANNVAQAQDPFGIAAVQAQPGFENYQPSFVNQELQPMGLVNETSSRLPDFKQMAKNVAEDQLKNYMIKKIGLDGIQGNIVKSIMGGSSLGLINPIGAVYTLNSLLPDGAKGIAEVLRNKRVSKAIQKDTQRDTQGDIKTVNLKNIQPTAQDIYRGGGPDPSSTTGTTSAPAVRQSRQTSGPGGLHSGY